MRILHIIASADLSEGGPVEGVFRLGDAFRAMGCEQHLLTLDPGGSDYLSDAPSPVFALGRQGSASSRPLARLRRWARYSPEALQWLRGNVAHYDGVIVDGLWNYATHMARRVLPDSGVPYVVFPHGMLDPWFRDRYPLKHAVKSMLWRVNEGPLLAHAQAVVFTTEIERSLARDTWRPWRSNDRVVGYGTAPPPAFTEAMIQAFQAKVPALEGRPYLLFLSRLHEKKGADLLLKAYAQEADALGCDLVMAGPAEPAYLHELQAISVPPGRVHWTGMIEGDAKWGALYGCEALALTSHQENFGVVVAEALACGKPVILSDQVNIFDQVQAAHAGVICRDTAGSAAEALARFARISSQERAAMGKRGSDMFARQFDICGTAQRLIAILKGG